MVALSGIAKSLQSLTSQDYIAGFWADSFPQCLLWFQSKGSVTSANRKSKRIQPYQAPTFSWASVTGAIIIYDFANALDGRPCRRVDRIDSMDRSEINSTKYAEERCDFSGTLATENLFGPIAEALLRITVFILEVAIPKDGLAFYSECVELPCFPIDRNDWQSTGASIWPDVDGATPDDLEICFDDRHWAIAFSNVCRTDFAQRQKMIAVGVSHSRPGAFERVGLIAGFPMDGVGTFSDWLDIMTGDIIILVYLASVGSSNTVQL